MSDRADAAGPSRRHLLLGGAAAGAGAAALIGADALLRAAGGGEPAAAPAPPFGTRTVAFHGRHQAGIATPPQAHARFIAFDLDGGADRDAVRRLLRLLSDDAARLTAGEAALADTEPELAHDPAGLTVTFGFGPGLVERVDPAAVPEWLGPLPEFGHDRLRERWCGGDLLLQICADDPVSVSHAARMLTKDTRAFARVRWVQEGFRRARGAQPEGTTMRNLMGQVDGTTNPEPGTEDFAGLVWNRGEGGAAWLRHGSALVVRRIAMDLEGWDRLDRPGREEAVGRRLSDGAPLTGGAEHDEPDFAAVGALGFPVIPEYAHIRRARSADPAERIFRRAYNYEDAEGAGLVFAAFQADVDRQFTPIQRRLDELDLLNEWVTAIGSAVFAVPPGCGPDGFIGETLFG
ncbi:Dyp-type peroxidase [Streptomonospora nanhaiensis]|uniref:Dye decolorizing peroxidase n=1 Tax=Streptomonospora nanhaiensis TaxID=1323731 RepID=A0A853BM90_9ACTN|nr:Dyp-type peroxidase [Streptomonospora nanhaiensis]MBV2363311.1 Dyp-type peroxidase [Streptomonospora nanhaiensis]MBX9390756.1 Dyp-type peroxidase [Streptomonospora nanhaiensis]NYI95671.1 dye decolorizing peroxidase [Streptomonospora nanhaiensis]